MSFSFTPKLTNPLKMLRHTQKEIILYKKIHLLVFSQSLIYGMLLAVYRLMTYSEIVRHKCLLLLRKSIRLKKKYKKPY